MVSPLITVVILTSLFGRGHGSVPAAVLVNYTRPGDFIIGAVLAFHFDDACRLGLTSRHVELVETFVFTVEQINNRVDILSNVTLGFDIRESCYSEDAALWSQLSLLRTHFKTPDPHRITAGKLLGVVGTSRSTTSIVNAKVANLYHLPMISHFATSDELSDKGRFPYFFRTVPPDKLQARAVVDILLRFGWLYVGVLYTLDSYGIRGSQELFNLAEKQGICVAFSESVPETPTQASIQEAVSKINEFKSARVLIIFGGSEMYSILEELQLTNPSYTVTLICSDSFGWRLSEEYLGRMTSGSLQLSLLRYGVPGFQGYFKGIQQTEKASPWFEEFKDTWMEDKGCTNLTQCPLATFDIGSTIYHGVYAFAHALDDFLHDQCFGKVDKCSVFLDGIRGQEFAPYLFNVSFTGVDGKFEFDANGDTEGAYVIQSLVGGEWELVGTWNSRGASLVFSGASLWPEGLPQSLCRMNCSASQIEIPLEKKCCWGCLDCQEKSIVVGKDCVQCHDGYWPSANRTVCEAIVPSSVSVHEVVIIIILVLCASGVIMAMLSCIGLFYYRKHPLVKASSRELSTIAITGTITAFLVPLPPLLPPSKHTCAAGEALISLCFTLTYTPTLLKVNRICRVFEAGKRSTKCPRLTRPRQLVAIAVLIISIQVVIVAVSGITGNLSKPEFLIPDRFQKYMEIYCLFQSGFIASCVYNLLLILACCYYAFRTRKVPSNYNESKFIAVSVYSTLVLCLAAVPVYATAGTVLQKVATLCLAVLLNAYLTLVCVYLPKLYAARFVKDVALLKCNSSVTTESSGKVQPVPGACTSGESQVMPSVIG